MTHVVCSTRFLYEGPGTKVSIAGSFNSWKQWEMIAEPPNKYYIDVILEPGKYLYKFFVDGCWIPAGGEQTNIVKDVTPKGTIVVHSDLTSKLLEHVLPTMKADTFFCLRRFFTTLEAQWGTIDATVGPSPFHKAFTWSLTNWQGLFEPVLKQQGKGNGNCIFHIISTCRCLMEELDVLASQVDVISGPPPLDVRNFEGDLHYGLVIHTGPTLVLVEGSSHPFNRRVSRPVGDKAVTFIPILQGEQVYMGKKQD